MGGYVAVAEAFDALAPRYDQLVEANRLHAYMRRRSVAWLDAAFRPGMRVLEIGCGSGTEAVHLAHRGVRVVATDISPRMVETTADRVRGEGLESHVRVVRCAAGELGDAFRGESFDGAYSSFGALNCEPNLPGTVQRIGSLLKPGGSFLASVVSRPCLPEILLGLARMRPARAFRRLRDEAWIGLYGAGVVRTRALGEAEFRRGLAPAFRIERLEGWLVSLPPPSAERAWAELAVLHEPLARLEVRLRDRWPFRAWGDHLHVWARRRLPG